MRIFFVSTFVGTFLPGTIGGDAYRAWRLTEEGVPASPAIASIATDRLLGVAGTLLGAAVGLALVPALLSDRHVLWPLGATVAGCVIAMAVIFSERVDSLLRRHLEWWPAPIRSTIARLLDALQAYRTHHATLGKVLLASLGVQGLRTLQAWMLGRSLGIDAALPIYVAFIPLIVLIVLLPVSINGLGTSQAAFVWCFDKVGVPPAASLALSVLFLALGIFGNLPGGLFYLTSGARREIASGTE
jgi:uncharacterized protein (TIRG00374 family)